MVGDLAELLDAADGVEVELGVELGGQERCWLGWVDGRAGRTVRAVGRLSGRILGDIERLRNPVRMDQQAAGGGRDCFVGVQSNPALAIVDLGLGEGVLEPGDGRGTVRDGAVENVPVGEAGHVREPGVGFPQLVGRNVTAL